MRQAWLGVFMAAGVAVAGVTHLCARPSAEELGRLAQLAQEDRELNKALDQVEARLWAEQSSVQLWGELARRHQSVSEVACKNLDGHYQGMVRLLASHEEPPKHSRVASVR
jgi:hypothetical protein